MIEAVIRGLIAICLAVAAVVLILWVLAQLGIALPSMVVKILWIIVALIVLLWLFRLLRPHAGGWLP
jgi:hypothetical protein